MPKKKKGKGVSAGTARRLVAKTVEDKTFGMKNKKGGKARKLIREVENQARAKYMGQKNSRRGGGSGMNPQQQAAEAKKRKQAVRQEAVMMAQMLGISLEDAKAAFTGKKVKKKKKKESSGEAEVGADGKKKKKKKGASGASETSAIKSAQARRRALRRQRKRAAGEEYEIDESLYEEDTPIEEIIEEERKALLESGIQLTPITFENFMAWKSKKKQKKDEKAIATKNVSGRLLFEQNAEKYNVDDDAAAADNDYEVTAADAAAAEAYDEEPLDGIPDIDSIPDIHTSDEEEEEEPEQVGGGAGKTSSSEPVAKAKAKAKATAPAEPAAASTDATNAALFMDEDLDDLDDLDDLE